LSLDLIVKIRTVIVVGFLGLLEIRLIPVSVVKISAVILWLCNTFLLVSATVLIRDIEITLELGRTFLLFLCD
jgi:hypothetical protein